MPRNNDPAVVISPTPRPLKKAPPPEDVIALHNEAMRAKATELFKRLVEGPVPISGDVVDVIVFMRAHGVRIKARMTPTGSFYELVDKGEPVGPTEGTVSPLSTKSEGKAP